jgi:hypothetical protein
MQRDGDENQRLWLVLLATAELLNGHDWDPAITSSIKLAKEI